MLEANSNTNGWAADSSRVDLFNMFRVTIESGRQVNSVIAAGLKENLMRRSAGRQPSSWCYLPTLPCSNDTGCSLGLSMMTSHFSFETGAVSLLNPQDCMSDSQYWRQSFPLPESLRFEDGGSVLEFMLTCLKRSLKSLPSGFSADCIGLSVGLPVDVKLRPPADVAAFVNTSASKDFHLANFFKEDVVSLANRACQRVGLDASVVCVANDCVATLLHGVHVTQRQSRQIDCSIGLVASVDCANVAYFEQNKDFLSACSPDYSLLLERTLGSRSCIVDANLWLIGINGEMDFAINQLDREIKLQRGCSPTWQDLASGLLFPDLLRYGIALMQATGDMRKYPKREIIRTSCCLQVIASCCNSTAETHQELLNELKPFLSVPCLDAQDADRLQRLCRNIVRRSAVLLSLGIVSVADRVYSGFWPSHLAVAVSGSLFKLIETLRQSVEENVNSIIKKMYPEHSHSKAKLIECSSALGAALEATAVSRWRQRVLKKHSDPTQAVSKK